MAQTPMTAIPIRQISPLEQGGALLDGAGPFAMQEALAQQQQEEAMNGTPDQQAQEKALVDQLKQQKDQISNSNKIRELALQLKEELQKSQELELELQDNPDAMDVVIRLLSDARNGGGDPNAAPTEEMPLPEQPMA